jgi:hypothetical protein
MKNDNLIKLTASGCSIRPAEPIETWPTYANIVNAFKTLAEAARAGDHVYIHYSGHGGRATTLFPEVKGKGGLDEALVPTDIDHGEGRYLRDVELANLLRWMVDKGLIVTVVLDSCHSGGMTRGSGGVAERGIPSVDARLRSRESMVASHSELVESWKKLAGQATRDATAGAGWLPEPAGYTLLSACRANEVAYEFPFGDRGQMGALTYWLLDSLRDLGPGLTYKILHDRIVSKVHGQFAMQTPQLQGEGDRVVFGTDRVKPFYAVNVIRSEGSDRVLLGVGQAHGVGRAACFTIFPHGTNVFEDLGRRLATVRVTGLGATESWAEVVQRLRDDPIDAGSQAVLSGPARVPLVRKVGLVYTESPGDASARAALDAVATILSAAGWIALAGIGEVSDFQVAVTQDGFYEILDSAGQPIPRLRPPLEISLSDSVAKLVRRLEHLSKYRALQELSNFDPLSPLARGLDVAFTAWSEDHEPGEPFAGLPLAHSANVPVLRPGWWIALRIRNRATVPLNVSLFDLQPDWGVTQIWPADASSFRLLDPGAQEVLPLRVSLPRGYDEGEDTLKVFATVGTTDFRWLELPPLDELPRASLQAPGNELERLFAAFSLDHPPTRNLEPVAKASNEWLTEQLTLMVRHNMATTPKVMSHEHVADRSRVAKSRP